MNKVAFYRQKLNYTQTELAEKSGLSLRTIQRIESGNIPKNHTLTSIAKVFEIDIEKLLEEQEDYPTSDWITIKFLNISALLFLIIPFGNLIFPIIIWYKNKTQLEVNKIGLQIINIQILWTLMTSVLLILCPFLQPLAPIKLPLLLVVFAILAVVNVSIILKNTISLHYKSTLTFTSPIHIF